MRPGSKWFAAAAAVVALAVPGCSVQFGSVTSGSTQVPMNEGRRADLVLEQSSRSGHDLTSLIRATWTQSAPLASWFVVVDRIADPENTVILEYEFLGFRHSSDRVGTPKHGYTTIHRTRAEVAFTLVDLRSGVVLATGSGSGAATGDDRTARDQQAVRTAIQAGLHRLMTHYTGVRS